MNRAREALTRAVNRAIAEGAPVYVEETEIERHVESRTNSIDRRFMAGDLTQKQYDKEMKDLSAWAEKMYKKKK